VDDKLLIELVPKGLGLMAEFMDPMEFIVLIAPTGEPIEPMVPGEDPMEPVGDPIGPDPEIPPAGDVAEPKEEPENLDRKV
jgi:hypothetical protein